MRSTITVVCNRCWLHRRRKTKLGKVLEDAKVQTAKKKSKQNTENGARKEDDILDLMDL